MSEKLVCFILNAENSMRYCASLAWRRTNFGDYIGTSLGEINISSNQIIASAILSKYFTVYSTPYYFSTKSLKNQRRASASTVFACKRIHWINALLNRILSVLRVAVAKAAFAQLNFHKKIGSRYEEQTDTSINNAIVVDWSALRKRRSVGKSNSGFGLGKFHGSWIIDSYQRSHQHHWRERGSMVERRCECDYWV
ncbi:MAG: hypothetical protein ACXW2U_16040 [Telluria sp.]